MPIIGATEEELRSVSLPACSIAAYDGVHARSGSSAAGLLHHSRSISDPVPTRTRDGVLLQQDGQWAAAKPVTVKIFTS
jgi:hypothetical protein